MKKCIWCNKEVKDLNELGMCKDCCKVEKDNDVVEHSESDNLIKFTKVAKNLNCNANLGRTCVAKVNIGDEVVETRSLNRWKIANKDSGAVAVFMGYKCLYRSRDVALKDLKELRLYNKDEYEIRLIND